MRPKRIKELLKCTKYADKTTTIQEEVDIEARSISIHTIVAGEQLLHFDAALNAARVQLLAKALARQSSNMAFILNRIDTGGLHKKFETELHEDMTALEEAGVTKEGE